MSNFNQTRQFGQRKSSAPTNRQSKLQINKGYEGFVKARDTFGSTAYWSFSAALLALALAMIFGSIARIDGLKQPLMMIFMPAANSLNITPADTREFQLDMFWLWSSSDWTIAFVTCLIWAIFTIAMFWALKKRFSWIGSAIGILSLFALIAGPSFVMQTGGKAKTERYMYADDFIAQTRTFPVANSASEKISDSQLLTRWIADQKRITIPAVQTARAMRAGVPVDVIARYDRSTAAMAKLMAAQYLAIKGDKDAAARFLPISLQDIVFHPESQLALAYRLSWLSDEVGTPAVDDPGALEQLEDRASVWALLLNVQNVFPILFKAALILLCLSLVAFLALSLVVLRLGIIKRRLMTAENA